MFHSDILAYKSAQYLAKIEKSSDAHIESSQTFFNARGGVSGGTIASFKTLTETDPYRVKRGMGEYALVTTGGLCHFSSPRMNAPADNGCNPLQHPAEYPRSVCDHTTAARSFRPTAHSS